MSEKKRCGFELGVPQKSDLFLGDMSWTETDGEEGSETQERTVQEKLQNDARTPSSRRILSSNIVYSKCISA